MGETPNARELAALHWFGYGQWSAAIWFVGMEPGGSDEDASYDSWLRLGGGELIGCRQHHLDCGFTRWHGGDRPATQATWRGLIRVLLAFENKSTDLEDIRQFQRNSFGSVEGNAALIELSALHSRSMKDSVRRESYRDARIATISQRLDQHCPQVALFYGYSYREYYERITGAPFQEDGTCWRGRTLCVLTQHPTARSSSGSNQWTELGHRLRLKTGHTG